MHITQQTAGRYATLLGHIILTGGIYATLLGHIILNQTTDCTYHTTAHYPDRMKQRLQVDMPHYPDSETDSR